MFKRNQKGFTLIELMIVIAIIGILAAIAIPNFIEYRNKSFCTRAEKDATTIASALSDYFSIPSHTSVPQFNWTNLVAPVDDDGIVDVALTGENSATVSTDVQNIVITVADSSGRCPDKYQQSLAHDATRFRDGWDGADNYIKYSRADQ
jgi:prepilin-type N-terminal cleavage/methylation domain-containing protein